MSSQLNQIYNYCFHILGIKPYTEFEMRKKIQGRFKNLQSETLDAVLTKLKELKYIDDTQFASDYIQFRLSLSPRGKFLLKQELLRKGINVEIITRALQKIPIDEVGLAAQLVEQKQKSLNRYPDQKKKEKIMRFLQSRGFSYGVIREVI